MGVSFYCRCSTDEQAESGLGMDAQLSALVAALGPVQEERIFRDDGYSGSRADRPGLVAALDALSKGDILAVAKRDRLARDMYLDLWIEREVEKRGATIQVADGNGNGQDPAAVLMRRMLAAFSEFERGVIRARTTVALAAKRAKGEKTGGRVPFGARISGYRKALRKRGGVLVEVDIPLLAPVAQEQAVIRLAFELAKGGLSLRTIGRVTGLGHHEKVRRALDRAARNGVA